METIQSIHVFRSTEIPSEPGAGGPRYRDFSADATLKALLPAEGTVALAWIEGREGSIVSSAPPRSTRYCSCSGAPRTLLTGVC